MNLARYAIALPAALLLAACAGDGPPQRERELPMPDPALALVAIRAADAGLDSAVQVDPLRDAPIEGFLAEARAAETDGRLADAVDAAERALALAPDAPDLLQYRAELDIAGARWIEAERRAVQSFKLGPKVGGLCARNWQTVVEARSALDDAATVEQARQRLAECRVKPRLRM